MATVLVTGAAGFLGCVISEHLLAAGHRVAALDNLSVGRQGLYHLCANPRLDFIQGDVRDERTMKEALAGVDAIIPLAAVVGTPACDRDPHTAASVNVDAIKLLNRLRHPDQAVLYPTTNSGYGTRSGDHFCTEETPLEPISLYGRTKVTAEQTLLDSPNVLTFRLATVFGVSPRMRLDLLVNHFTYAAVRDRYLVVFEKHFKRNYVHIRDVADCFVYALAHFDAMKGRCYNVGLDAANLSKEELALTITKHVPGFYVHFADVGADPDKRNYIVSNDRLRQAGFEAQRSIDLGIEELVKAYRMLGRGEFQNA